MRYTHCLLYIACGSLLFPSPLSAENQTPFSTANLMGYHEGSGATDVADLDGDGDMDIVTIGGYAVFWWENVNGDGSSWKKRYVSTQLARYPESLYVVDMDLDGDPDVLAPSFWYENVKGNATVWTVHAVRLGEWMVFYPGDMDSDGDVDIAGFCAQNKRVAWIENMNGDGLAWTEHVVTNQLRADEYVTLSAADVDGDGDADIITGLFYGKEVAWWENTEGDGTLWTNHLIDANFVRSRHLNAADLDGDGDLDVAGASDSANVSVVWWENADGDGSNWSRRPISAPSQLYGSSCVNVCDIDQDGDFDLLVPNQGVNGGVMWWENADAVGGSWIKHAVGSVCRALFMCAGDIDGDGDSDIVARAYLSPNNPAAVVWHENQTPPRGPVADAGGPYTVNEGMPLTLDASGSSAVEGRQLEYRWDFNSDGVWDTGLSTNPTIPYTWGDNGVTVVTVEVTDGYAASTGMADVTVTNVAPSTSIDVIEQPNLNFILPAVHELSFRGSFSDPGCLDSHSAEWDFGDGTVAPGALTEENEFPDATGTFTGVHLYQEPGTYTVTLTVSDDDGAMTRTTVTVKVLSVEEAIAQIRAYIQEAPDTAFKSPAAQRKNALDNKLVSILGMVRASEYQEAIEKLWSDIRSKADGSLGGAKNNGWITDPKTQSALCGMLDDLIVYLETLR